MLKEDNFTYLFHCRSTRRELSTLMKAIVVEDSRLAREGLLRMLESHPSIDIVGAADHPNGARQLVAQHHPDLMFLDIHMPGESGFDLLDSMDYLPKVVFTTAFSEHAYRSFDYQAVDYLLKPISPERLAEAIDKLSNEKQEAGSSTVSPLELDSKMFIKDGDHCHLVSLRKIRYFESCKNYVRVFFDDEKAFVKKTLSAIEMRLPKQHFFRVSRQYIVNLMEVESINEGIGDGYELGMSDGQVIDVSRRNAAELKTMLSF